MKKISPITKNLRYVSVLLLLLLLYIFLIGQKVRGSYLFKIFLVPDWLTAYCEFVIPTQ